MELAILPCCRPFRVSIIPFASPASLQVLRNDNGLFVKANANSLADKPYFVFAADVTGDGKADLVTANLESNTLTLLAHSSSANAISFAAAQTLGANTGPQSLAAVDIDLDGDLDLLVADGSQKNVTILRNRGQGVLAAPESAGIATFAASVAHSLVAADLNSDGLPDIVAARGDGHIAADDVVSVINYIYAHPFKQGEGAAATSPDNAGAQSSHPQDLSADLLNLMATDLVSQFKLRF